MVDSIKNLNNRVNVQVKNENKVAINLLALVGDMTLVQNFMHGDMHIKNWTDMIIKKIY